MHQLIPFLLEKTKVQLASQSKGRKATPHRIKFDGQFIKTRSGKTVWPSIGAAKLAWNLEVQNALSYLVYVDWSNSDIRSPKNLSVREFGSNKMVLDKIDNEEWRKIQQEYTEAMTGRVEFVPTTTEDFFINRNR